MRRSVTDYAYAWLSQHRQDHVDLACYWPLCLPGDSTPWGYVTDQVAQWLQATPFFKPFGRMLCVMGDVELALTRAHEVLLEHDACPRRAPERLALNVHGQVVASFDRTIARALGIQTQAVRLLWCLPHCPAEFYIGLRSPHKRIHPLKWDNMAAGLVGYGETSVAAVLREAREEAGLNLKEASLMIYGCLDTIRPDEYGLLRETTTLYVAKQFADIPENRDGEVLEFKRSNWYEVMDLAEQGLMMPEAMNALMIGWIHEMQFS